MKGKKKWNKRILRAALLAVLAVGVLAAGIRVVLSYAGSSTSGNQAQTMEGTVQKGSLDLTVTANGTTTGTTDYQLYSLGDEAVKLEIESVAVLAGDTVKKGDTLYTLTKDSVESAKESLESDWRLYQEELAQAKMDYKDAVVEAETEYETNLALASTAALDYQDTLDSYRQNVETQEKKLKEVQSIIKNYPGEISSAGKELKEAKNQKKELQKKKTAQEVKTQSAKKKFESLQKEYEALQKAYSEIATVAKYFDSYQGNDDEAALASLQKTVSEELAEKKNALEQGKVTYETAKKAYEHEKKKSENLTAKVAARTQKITELSEEIDSKETSLKEAEKSLSSCQAQYYTAVSEQTLGKVTAKQSYEEDMNTSQNAKRIYKAALQSAREALQAAKDNYRDAKAKKKVFASLVNGRMVQADREGTIAAIAYQAGNTLNANIPLAGYQDSSVMNIEVSVDQEDIACIKVGDEVEVNLSSARGGTKGTVASIETSSSSESVSSVSYTVIVTVDNSSGNIGTSETAMVSFSKGTMEDVLYVPVTAVETDASKSLVTVKQKDGTTRQVQVTTGESNGQFIVIESGLEEGDTYVVQMES